MCLDTARFVIMLFHLFELSWNMTMMFSLPIQEKINICRYYDSQSGLWLLLPLQWEMDIDFVKQRVQRIMVKTWWKHCKGIMFLLMQSQNLTIFLFWTFKDTLPGLVDQKEITAALRLCNYDPDEVMSVYLTIFGDSLFQSSRKAQNFSELNSELNSFRYISLCQMKSSVRTIISVLLAMLL